MNNDYVNGMDQQKTEQFITYFKDSNGWIDLKWFLILK